MDNKTMKMNVLQVMFQMCQALIPIVVWGSIVETDSRQRKLLEILYPFKRKELVLDGAQQWKSTRVIQ